MTNEEIRAEFGVTGELLDEWAAEYEGGMGSMRFGAPSPGRPKLYDEPMESITVKVPKSRVAALSRAAKEGGVSRSEIIRRAIDHELLALA